MAQEYQRILTEVFERYQSDLETAMAGSLLPYCYQEGEDKEKGTFDKNYGRRQRLCYALLFFGKKHPGWTDEEYHDLVRRMFEQELMDRETNSFQGIGASLEILTQLLQAFDSPEDKPLFERAKNANFDCSCGYVVQNYGYPDAPDVLSLEDGIYTMIDLQEKDAARQLIAIWKENKGILCTDDYRTLGNWQKWLGDKGLEADARRNELENMLLEEEKNAWTICSACERLIRVLIEAGMWDEARERLMWIRQWLKPARDKWWGIGLGRFVLEDCMDLVLHGGGREKELWEWSHPFLLLAAGNMHGNLYRKAAEAARMMGDSKLGDEMDEGYRNLFR